MKIEFDPDQNILKLISEIDAEYDYLSRIHNELKKNKIKHKSIEFNSRKLLIPLIKNIKDKS